MFTFFLFVMDPEWIVARAFIKQEEPADYVFVSSVDDEELNVTFNTTYGNEADSEVSFASINCELFDHIPSKSTKFQENQFLVEVKQEMDVFIKQEDELDIHSETDDGIQSDTLSSEYVPSDSECNIKNDTDDVSYSVIVLACAKSYLKPIFRNGLITPQRRKKR